MNSCHTGNTKVLSSSKGEGGSLFLAGWAHGGYHSSEMTVIDVSGAKVRPWCNDGRTHAGNYYVIVIDDELLPKWSIFFWESLAMLIYNELKTSDVLIACYDGHTGASIAVAIIAWLLTSKRHVRIFERDMLIEDPVAWVRYIHCPNAIPFEEQEEYIYSTIRGDLSYTDTLVEWNTAPDNGDVYLCPVCQQELATIIQALMHCSPSDSLRVCPVCGTKHDLPIEAYNCCRR